jgi:hypothetical protein
MTDGKYHHSIGRLQAVTVAMFFTDTGEILRAYGILINIDRNLKVNLSKDEFNAFIHHYSRIGTSDGLRDIVALRPNPYFNNNPQAKAEM